MSITAFIAVAVIYALAVVYLYVAQERLIFPGAGPNHLVYHRLDRYSCDITGAGGRLQGWRVPGAARTGNSVAIFFGGNGQDVCDVQATFERVAVESTYAFNYRGYGLSEGKPSEAVFYNDALFIFDTIRKEYAGKSLVVIGQSLGSAVAGYIATQREVDKLILITPLSSVKDVVRWRFKNTFPTLLVKHSFELSEYAKAVTCDTLIISAGQDNVIPRHLSMKTFHNLRAARTLCEVPAAGHNTVYSDGSALLAINAFVIQATEGLPR